MVAIKSKVLYRFEVRVGEEKAKCGRVSEIIGRSIKMASKGHFIDDSNECKFLHVASSIFGLKKIYF